MFAAYFSGRTQCGRSPRSSSLPSALLHGVPQGSVLEPILFLPYTADVADVLGFVRRHQLHPHANADDTQIYGFCSPSAVSALVDRVSACFDDVSAWTKSNRLHLNPLKTDVLWCSFARRQYQIPTSSAGVGGASITQVSTVQDLSVHLDSDVTMTTHVTVTVRACFAVLQQIRSV